jgi:putative transposase
MDMKPSRFTEEQIIGILREQEAGTTTADVCRKHGISSATFYKWKAKYGGLAVSDAKRLKALEDENAKLKKLLAEAMLDNAMLKDIAAKNVWSAPALQGLRSAVRSSLRKCIRPLASELLLQPGHDEMRAHRSQQMVRAKRLGFLTGLTMRRSTVPTSVLGPRNLTNVMLRHVPARSVRRGCVGA